MLWLDQRSRVRSVFLSSYPGLPRRLSGRESAWQCRRHRRWGFDPWVGKIPWSCKRHPTPVFLPGEFHGQKNLAGYSHRSQTVGHDQSYLASSVWENTEYIISDGSQRSRKLPERKMCGSREGIKEEEISSVKIVRKLGKNMMPNCKKQTQTLPDCQLCLDQPQSGAKSKEVMKEGKRHWKYWKRF